MLLYLLRHAEAEPCGTADFSRRLTEKGIAQAERVGEFLLARNLKPDLILTSPFKRAKETARIIFEKLRGQSDLSEVSWLACGMDPGTAMEELTAYAKFDSIMIVGHEPDFSGLIATFLGMGSSGSVNVGKASLTAIDLSRFTSGGGVLRFFLPVKFLR